MWHLLSLTALLINNKVLTQLAIIDGLAVNAGWYLARLIHPELFRALVRGTTSPGRSRESWLDRMSDEEAYKRMSLLDLIAHAALCLVLLVRHRGTQLVTPTLCAMSYCNSRLWGFFTARHPYPGLQIGTTEDEAALKKVNDIYEFVPTQGPAVWGVAYTGEALVLLWLLRRCLPV